jgi:hypothetical protein
LIYDNGDEVDDDTDNHDDNEYDHRCSHGRTNKDSTIVMLVSNGTSIIRRKQIHLLNPKLLLDAAAAAAEVLASVTSRP